jgi:superfamily II DNA or RNA helicase
MNTEQTKIYIKLLKNSKNRIKLETNSDVLLKFIKARYTTHNPAFRFAPHAPKEVCLISPTNTFNCGMAMDIIQVAREKYPQVIIDITEVKDIIRPFSYSILDLEQAENPEFIYRDYQEEAIKLFLKFGRGVINYPTGSGKSLIIYGLIKNIWKCQQQVTKTILIVPNCQLVVQMYKDFINYGCSELNVCKFSSNSTESPTAPIIISNRQWLNLHSDELPEDIDIVIVDEAHTLNQGTEVSKYVNKFKTQKRFGVSGTIPDDVLARWNVIGICGKILKTIMPSTLQNEGVIVDTKIICIRFNHHVSQPQPEEHIEDPLQLAKLIYPLEMNYIEHNEFVNNAICKAMYSLKNNTIILYDHIEHGNTLKAIMDIMNVNNKKIFQIDGSTEIEYRENVRATLEVEDNCILIANTACFSTGINIKNIHNIGFAFASGKSLSKVIQSVGRGLRTKEGKAELFLVDFYHSFKYSSIHFGQRLNLYKKHYNVQNLIFKTIDVT